MSHLESVDNALRLVVILAQGRRVSVTEVAKELDIAPSTAHRLLRTLVYRRFAQQAGDRSYAMGPALMNVRGSRRNHTRLMDVGEPHLRRLAGRTNETSHLVILVSRDVRFLFSVESQQALRIGSRAGQVMPAHLTASGKVLLADLSDAVRLDLYPLTGVPELALSEEDIARLHRELTNVQRRGYALNKGMSERGLSAVAAPVRDEEGRVLAAVTVSMPTVRYSAHKVESLVSALREACAGISAELASAG